MSIYETKTCTICGNIINPEEEIITTEDIIICSECDDLLDELN